MGLMGKAGSMLMDFDAVVEDPNASQRNDLIVQIKAIILNLAQEDDAAIGALIDAAASEMRKVNF